MSGRIDTGLTRGAAILLPSPDGDTYDAAGRRQRPAWIFWRS
jgi:hypothetical protein